MVAGGRRGSACADPRWRSFINPLHPEGRARVESWKGVNPESCQTLGWSSSWAHDVLTDVDLSAGSSLILSQECIMASTPLGAPICCQLAAATALPSTP